MNTNAIKNMVEAALMVAGRPLNIDGLLAIFGDGARPERSEIRGVLKTLSEEYTGRGIELVEVASGFRIQAAGAMSESLSRLWQERPPRYSRALLETLALIAYRQPITRGEIEDVRGVSVSSNIIRTLLERRWIRVLGHRDVPGRPEMFGTTKEFLDYFGLRRLDDLPSLAELRDFDSLNVELDLGLTDAELQVVASAAEGESAAAEELPTAEAKVAADDESLAQPDEQVPEEGVAEETRTDAFAEPVAGESPAVKSPDETARA
jgi:segregation and condensation protein B